MQPLAHCNFLLQFQLLKNQQGEWDSDVSFDLHPHISLQSFSQHDWQKELLATSGHGSHHSEFSHLPDFKPAHFRGEKLGD
jgi:hypothetical protein